jgi:uncharacterized membrane protein
MWKWVATGLVAASTLMVSIAVPTVAKAAPEGGEAMVATDETGDAARRGCPHDARIPFPGFVLDRGRFTTVEAPEAANQTLAYGVNNRGQIVGGYDDADGVAHGFVRDKRGRFTTYDVPGAYATIITRINDRGQMVGDYFETSDTYAQGVKRGFLLDDGKLTRIDFPEALSTEAAGIDNFGRVVGEAFDAQSVWGYVWKGGRFTTLEGPGNGTVGAAEINERGQITGGYSETLDAPTRAFLLRGDKYTTFDAFGATFTQAFGIDIRGRVVGYTASGFDLADPIVLLDAHGYLRDEKGRFTRIDFPCAPRTLAYGINDRGQIVGQYENPNAAQSADPTQASDLRAPAMGLP